MGGDKITFEDYIYISWAKQKQDPVSTMQNVCWSKILSSFLVRLTVHYGASTCCIVYLVWSGHVWKKSFTYGLDHLHAVKNNFLVYEAILASWQTNKRPPRWTQSKHAPDQWKGRHLQNFSKLNKWETFSVMLFNFIWSKYELLYSIKAAIVTYSLFTKYS